MIMGTLTGGRRRSEDSRRGDEDDDRDSVGCTCSLPVVGVSARRVELFRSVLARSQEQRSHVFILNLKSREDRTVTSRTPGRKVSRLVCGCIYHVSLYFLPGVMSGCRAGLVLLCAALAVTRARRSSPELEDVQEKINSARCTSRCLTLHMTQLTAAFRHLQVLCLQSLFLIEECLPTIRSNETSA